MSLGASTPTMDEKDQPELVPVAARPINLVPVGLKEAALDSPSFRATAHHFFEQVDAVEKWLDSVTKAITKISLEALHFETLIAAVNTTVVPPTSLSEAILDHDYTLLAGQKYGEISRIFWGQALGSLKKLETQLAEPLRHFINTNLHSFKESRRQLDSSRNAFDQASARYAAMLKTKEPSSIREEAFQLHEARRTYLKASLDVSIAAPQLRSALDKVLIKVFYDHGQTMWKPQNSEIAKWSGEVERIRGWLREMEESEKSFRRDMQSARKQIENATEAEARPSRELDDYAQSTAPVALLTKGPASALPSSKPKSAEKQGWLYLRTLSGKPTRTLWTRRWFYVKNGLFGCLVQGSRSGGVEESERIGVLLCGVRAAANEERRFCFEVKTKDITIVLQAESQHEMVEWMGTFDLAKQKALNDPTSTDAFTDHSSNVLDPAFAITPPSAPEFTASLADAGLHATNDDNHDRSSSLTLPASDTMPLHRNSFDVSASRRSTAFEKENESTRERLKHKLDVSRKTSTGLGPTIGSQSSGIASLISATHTSMPIGPGAIASQAPEQTTMKPPLSAKATVAPNKMAFLARTMPASSLAPATLANPPAATNLSSTAVAVNSERGIGVGTSDMTGGMPSGMLANLWGSTNWGYINRFERGEVKPQVSNDRPATIKPRSPLFPSNRQSAIESTGNTNASSVGGLTGSLSTEGSPAHRKATSFHGEVSLQPKASTTSLREFPNYYPIQLKHQDAQFRLLFPNVKRSEKLVLVFRATWVPNEHQEFPGRVYVTPEHIFFYSNHLGLVLVTGFALSRVTEITAAPGRDCDFLFLHLKGARDELDFARLTIKTFLHNLRLLQKRLNFMIQNCSSTEPKDLETIMKTMIRLESEINEKGAGDDSLDELSDVESFRRYSTRRGNKDLRTKILVDPSLSSSISSLTGRDSSFKFKLPNKPVVYVPRGMSQPVVERTFDISPKALFHVLFGDRSAVWQLLHHERRARHIRQGPWVQEEKTHTRRAFEYDIEFPGWFFGTTRQAVVMDTQIIDVHNDHLCYVVTDRKTPWHLPYHDEYTLVTKIVITHETKSKSKLALYTRIDWNRSPFLVGAILERNALADLHLDALDLTDVVAEQVRKLGAFSNTKKAIQIFGHVGQQTQVIEFQDIEAFSKHPRRPMGKRSMAQLLFNALTNFNANLIASIVALSLSIIRWVWRTIGVHRVILAILTVSMFTNFMFSSRETSLWWRERHARHYMDQLGIGKNLVMNKAISLSDTDIATTIEGIGIESTSFNPCLQKFLLASAGSDPTLNSPDPAILYLQRSRQRLETYRHDLLVAMRVVNRVEKEIIQAGWEDWVLAETHKCESMGQLLSSHGKRSNSTETEQVQSALKSYCNSCTAAQAAMAI